MDEQTEQDTRHWRRGTIMQNFLITCQKCLQEGTAYSYDKKRVILDAEKAGWRCIHGHWYCPTCATQPEKG